MHPGTCPAESRLLYLADLLGAYLHSQWSPPAFYGPAGNRAHIVEGGCGGTCGCEAQFWHLGQEIQAKLSSQQLLPPVPASTLPAPLLQLPSQPTHTGCSSKPQGSSGDRGGSWGGLLPLVLPALLGTRTACLPHGTCHLLSPQSPSLSVAASGFGFS